jgi:hypothetical protein
MNAPAAFARPARNERLRALVSGMSAENRARCWLVMLQGFLDDSGSSSNDPVFVVGGFISSVVKWEAFSDAWTEALKRDPPIDYFKASEARNREGQFKHGWNRPLIEQRIFELTEVACEHAQFRVHCFMRRSHFEQFSKLVAGSVPGQFLRNFQNPYFLCVYGTAIAVALHKKKNGITDPVEYVLDEHGTIGDIAVSAWHLARDAIGQDVTDLIESPPAFRNDKKVKPLQAADLYAWNIHDMLVYNRLEWDEFNHIKRMFGKVEDIELYVSSDFLSEFAADVIESFRG